MDTNDVKNIIVRSVRNLYRNQPNLYDFTSITHQTEWNLGHQLAYELQKDTFLSRFDCDLDIVKTNFDNRRPDIIFHKRGDNKYNFLVVELKYNKEKKELDEDMQKIKDNWFQCPLQYDYGAVVNLGASVMVAPLIQVVKNLAGVNVTQGYKTI